VIWIRPRGNAEDSVTARQHFKDGDKVNGYSAKLVTALLLRQLMGCGFTDVAFSQLNRKVSDEECK
jgi:hypothetical protein